MTMCVSSCVWTEESLVKWSFPPTLNTLHYSHRRICLRRYDSVHFREGPGEHESNLLQSISVGGSGNDKLEGGGRQNKLKSAESPPVVAWAAGRCLEDAKAKWNNWAVGLQCVCVHGGRSPTVESLLNDMRRRTGSGHSSVTRKSKRLFTGGGQLRRRRHSPRSGPTCFILDFHAGRWLSKSITPSLTAVSVQLMPSFPFAAISSNKNCVTQPPLRLAIRSFPALSFVASHALLPPVGNNCIELAAFLWVLSLDLNSLIYYSSSHFHLFYFHWLKLYN